MIVRFLHSLHILVRNKTIIGLKYAYTYHQDLMKVRNKTIIGLKYYWVLITCTRIVVRNKTIIGLKYNFIYLNQQRYVLLEIRL